MTIIVNSKPSCVQCDATYRFLDKEKLEYTPVDMTTDEESFARAQAAGALSAPFVEVIHSDGTRDSWSGFRIEKLRALVSA